MGLLMDDNWTNGKSIGALHNQFGYLRAYELIHRDRNHEPKFTGPFTLPKLLPSSDLRKLSQASERARKLEKQLDNDLSFHLKKSKRINNAINEDTSIVTKELDLLLDKKKKPIVAIYIELINDFSEEGREIILSKMASLRIGDQLDHEKMINETPSDFEKYIESLKKMGR